MEPLKTLGPTDKLLLSPDNFASNTYAQNAYSSFYTSNNISKLKYDAM